MREVQKLVMIEKNKEFGEDLYSFNLPLLICPSPTEVEIFTNSG